MIGKRFRNGYHFVSQIRVTIEFWHPYLVSLVPFEISIDRWPSSPYPLILYGRILSFFPHFTKKMIWVAHRLYSIKDYSSGYTYTLQFLNIGNSRQRGLSKDINEIEKGLDIRITSLNMKFKQFWEGVLQKDYSNTWLDYLNIRNRISGIRETFEQLCYRYPINSHILKRYYLFIDQFVHDPVYLHQLYDKYVLISSNDFWRVDPSVESAISVFSCFQQVLNEVQENNEEDALSEAFEDTTNDIAIDFHKETVDNNSSLSKLSIDSIIKSSPIGQIGFSLILLIFSTIFIVILSGYVFLRVHSSIILPHQIMCSSIEISNRFRLEYSRLVCLFSFIRNIYSEGIFSINRFSNLSTLDSVTGYSFGGNIDSELLLASIHNCESIFSDFLSYSSLCLEYFSNFSSTLQNLLFSSTSESESFERVVNGGFLKMKFMYNQYNVSNSDYSINYLELLESTSIINSDLDFFNKIILKNQFNQNSRFFFEFRDSALWIVLFLLGFITLPYVLNSYRVGLEKTSIIHSLISFSGSSIRNILVKLGQVEGFNDHKSSCFFKGSNKVSIQGSSIKQFLVYSLFLPSVIILMILVFKIQTFLMNSNLFPSSINFITSSSGYIYQGFLYILNIVSSESSNFSSNIFSREELFNLSHSYFSLGKSNLKNSFLVKSSILNGYLSSDSFTKYETLLSNLNHDISSNSIERLFFNDYLSSLSSLCLFYDIFEYRYQYRSVNISDFFLDIMYSYIVSSLSKSRDSEFFECIINYSHSDSNSLSNYLIYFFVILSIWHIFLGVYILVQLIHEREIMIGGLSLYQFFEVDNITRNSCAMRTVLDGSLETDNIVSFPNPSILLDRLDTLVVITDRFFEIKGYNRKFQDYNSHHGDGEEEVFIGTNFISLFKSSVEVDGFFERLRNMINCGELIRISKVLKFYCHMSKKEIFLQVEPLFLSDIGPIDYEYSISEVKNVAFCIEDITKSEIHTEMIKKEQDRMISLLKNVIPDPIVQNIISGQDHISFNVSSVTVSSIRVDFEISDIFEEVRRLNLVFDFINNSLCEEKDIWKVRTFSHSFLIIGGLFNQTCRSDRCAIDIIHFLLKLQEQVAKQIEILGFQFSLTIGVHSGGPITAGIMNIKHPQLQIIGEVFDLCNQMKATAPIGSIQITRRVYELIYTQGFNVIERGEINISKSRKIDTYQILS